LGGPRKKTGDVRSYHAQLLRGAEVIYAENWGGTVRIKTTPRNERNGYARVQDSAVGDKEELRKRGIIDPEEPKRRLGVLRLQPRTEPLLSRGAG